MDLLKRRALTRLLPRLALLLLAWFTLSGHALSGCKGLFTPAVPEPPTGPPVEHDYSSPEATLRTMAEGMAAKGQGSSAWQGAFADSTSPDDDFGYHQIFDPDVLTAFVQSGGTAPTDWRWKEEGFFFQDFTSTVHTSDSFEANFDSLAFPQDPPAGADEALVYRSYKVVARPVDSPDSTIIAIGTADLTFRRTRTNQWLITRWVDHVDPAVGLNPADQEQVTLGRRRLDHQ
jgi:hypothetical protein